MTEKHAKDVLTDTAKDVWYAGLGLFSTMEEEGEKLFNQFKDKGKDLEKTGSDLAKKGQAFEKKAKEKVEDLPNPFNYVEDTFKKVVEKIDFASNKEVTELSKKVDKLTEIVATLAKKLDSAPKAAAKK